MSIIHSSSHNISGHLLTGNRSGIDNVRFQYYKKAINLDLNVKVPTNAPKKSDPKICIIGAGMSGLFAALLLDIAGLKNIEILECQNRLGGRVHTEYYPGSKEDKLYGELGAMRLPKSTTDPDHGHQMVFDTIKYLNEKNHCEEAYKIETIKFVFDDKELNGRYFFNDALDGDGNIMTQKYAESATIEALGFPQSVDKDYRKLYEDSLKFWFPLLDDFNENTFKVLKELDKESVHSYLRKYLYGRVYPEKIEETIAAMETTESATGLFRLSFVETLMDSYTFLHENQEWKTIKYGMQRFPNAFEPILKDRITINYKSKVFKLKNESTGGVRVFWKRDDDEQVYDKVYDKVIVTCPFGVVRQWELPEKLDEDKKKDYDKRRAIRELNYDNATKIFLKFKSRFWEDKDKRPIIGGNSLTDLPIRKVIYPSYYMDDQCNPDKDGPAILLGSYTWANDAAKYAPYQQKDNVRLCLENLKTLHKEVVDLEKIWDDDKCSNSSIYWPNVPTAVGAYAFFGPRQYEELLYPMLNDSQSNIHWAGEHTDIHHAWIIGALNSAVRVVREVLLQTCNEKKWECLLSHELLAHWEWKKFEGKK